MIQCDMDGQPSEWHIEIKQRVKGLEVKPQSASHSLTHSLAHSQTHTRAGREKQNKTQISCFNSTPWITARINSIRLRAGERILCQHHDWPAKKPGFHL